MGKRGPQPTPTEVLKRRGSWRAAAREKQEREPKPPQKKRKIPPVPTEAELTDICRTGIPKYDPWRGAEEHGYEFRADLAVAAVAFFHEELTHVKGALAGEAFRLEPWQMAIVGNLFGWVKLDTELRRYRQTFILVARKAGKTPLAAGMILYLLFEDQEPGAELYGAGAEYKQGALVFEHARGMVFNNPRLDELCRVYSGTSKSIQLHDDFSTYRVISSDAYSSHGYNTHAYVVDEVHTQPDRDLVDTLETSTGARRQPLAILITTADFARESICNEKHDYALQVRDGVITDHLFMPVIYQYEPDHDGDWRTEEAWGKANPNMGVSVSLDYLKAACKKAQEIPTFENTFRRLHLCQRTESDIRWLQLEKWDACNKPARPEGPCYAGLDLSSTTDISALVLYFPENGAVLPYFWIPSENARRRERRDRVPYITWEKQGLIEFTDGNVIDYDVIRARINEISQDYDIKEIAIDRWNSTQLQNQLMGDGREVVQFGQGYASMTAPTKELEKLVMSGGIRHGGNALLRWMASNVSVEEDAAGNLKPSKKKSTERIDGIVSLIMAIGRHIAQEQDQGSVYKKRGIRTFA